MDAFRRELELMEVIAAAEDAVKIHARGSGESGGLAGTRLLLENPHRRLSSPSCLFSPPDSPGPLDPWRAGSLVFGFSYVHNGGIST